MAIADRINAMYDHVGEIYDTLELGGDTTQNKNIVNINTEIKREYKDFLAHGTDVLWNNWEKVSGTGETLTLDNTMEGKMEIEYKGNTYQYSTSGNNLFNVNGEITNINTNFPTTVVDGKINIVTSSNSGNAISSMLDWIPVEEGKTYKLNYVIVQGNVRYGFRLFDSSKNLINNSAINITNYTYLSGYQGYYGASNASFTIPSGYGIKYIRLITFAMIGDVSPIILDKAQVNEGTTVLPYEPYTNGASPNPDYPQPIQVVSGDNTIKVEGKNLCNLGTPSDYTPTGRVQSINNNIMSIKVYRSGETFTYKTNQNYEGNKTYTISANASTTNSRLYIRLRKLDDSNWMTSADASLSGWEYNSYYKSWFNNFLTTNINTTITIPNCLYWQIGFGWNSTQETTGTTQTLSNIQIELNNVSTSFEEYQSATYPISLGNIELCKIGTYQDKIAKSTGKNLWNENTQAFTNQSRFNNPTKDSNNVWTFTISGSNGYAFATSNITLQAGTYTASATVNNGDFLLQKNGITINNTFTLTEETEITFRVYKNGNVGDIVKLSNVMIEKNNQATPYEPYGKVWYLNKQIGKVALNGSETIYIYSQNTNRTIFSVVGKTNDIEIYTDTSSIPQIISSYFKSVSQNASWVVGDISRRKEAQTTIYLTYEPNTTVEQFKTWLSTHNIEVYYILATPTYEEITDTTLLSQLEALAYSYEGTTNISQVNDDLPFVLDITALKEMS